MDREERDGWVEFWLLCYLWSIHLCISSCVVWTVWSVLLQGLLVVCLTLPNVELAVCVS